MHTVQTDIEFAVSIAIQSREYLIEKWRGEYGMSMGKDVRDGMILMYEEDVARLRRILKKHKEDVGIAKSRAILAGEDYVEIYA